MGSIFSYMSKGTLAPSSPEPIARSAPIGASSGPSTSQSSVGNTKTNSDSHHGSQRKNLDGFGSQNLRHKNGNRSRSLFGSTKSKKRVTKAMIGTPSGFQVTPY
jgi:hypothetical protein